MSVTAYKSPGTCVNADRDSKGSWSDPSYAQASDNNRASFSAKGDYSDWLRVTSFGFTASDIPAGATLDGIEVSIERSSYLTVHDSALYLRKTSGQVGSNYASGDSWPSSDASKVYGSATDKWGTTWADSDIKSSNFGLDISVFTDGIGAFAYIDHIKIRVYYTVSSQTILQSGISQPQSIGQPKLSLVLKPSGIAQPQSVGEPTIAHIAIMIYPPGIAQAVEVGMPSLIYPQVIASAGITQTVSLGEPWLGLLGFIKPVGIEQQISIGSPSLYKYVWHVVLDGQYKVESPDKNRFYVIGRDDNGNPVYGTAIESTEAGLVGERLDFLQELAVPTDGQAASMASALLAKMRLTGKKGVIVIPPNCGQELFDVVQISDSGANQQAVSFRVVGIRFEYNPKQARFEHKLILGAV